MSCKREGRKTSDLRIGSVVIDCVRFDEMLAFWKEALGYAPRDPVGKDWAVLRDPSGRNTNVSLNKVRPSGKLSGRNWLHFDLYATDQKGEVERLLKLGAKRHAQEYDQEDDFVVLEDPDGNLFCVVDVTRKVVGVEDVPKMTENGWELKARLPGGKAIVGRARTPA